jgi:hypothetical protein
VTSNREGLAGTWSAREEWAESRSVSDVDNKATRGMALLTPGLGPAMVGVPQVSVLTPGLRPTSASGHHDGRGLHQRAIAAR